MNLTVLVVDDEEKLRKLLLRMIGLEGYTMLEAGSLAAAEQIIAAKQPDIVLCDVKLPDGSGVDFVRRLREQYPSPPEIVLLTAYGNISDGVTAMRNGAFDYLVKGDDNEKIIPLLSRIAEKMKLQQQVSRLEGQLGKKYAFEKIIGNSTVLQAAIAAARKVSVTDTAVLLNGETGTGKEVFAQAIHYQSKRAGAPFVALNCSSFSKDLLESELFGHRAGAFTGATRDQKGLIDEAKGGTLFLDEIGELPLELQPKLLRLLESGAYYRVGDTKQYTADIRLVAATNRDLSEEAAAGRFRADLFYRIAVFTITLPPLRERVKDIPALADHFLRIYAAKAGLPVNAIDDAAMKALQQHGWRGNIRELKNVIERAVILEDTGIIHLDSLPFELRQPLPEAACMPDSMSLAAVEQQHIRKVLQHTAGNKAEAARLLGIGIATLYRKMEEYGWKQEPR